MTGNRADQDLFKRRVLNRRPTKTARLIDSSTKQKPPMLVLTMDTTDRKVFVLATCMNFLSQRAIHTFRHLCRERAEQL